MNSEYGLMIIWKNALVFQDKIIDDLKKRFEIINLFQIQWDEKIFSKNLSRFYGENLPKNSFKEKHCGNGEFLLIILKDNSPLYLYRKTSKGKKKVNVNLFDSKEMYRSWTGQHMIHATNDEIEFKHDLMLLLGVNTQDYFKKFKKSNDIIKLKQNIVGNEGFQTLEQVFYVLNETIKYVVLRNFTELPEKYIKGEHGDIDILTESEYNIVSILDATKEFKVKSRVRYFIKLKGSSEKIYFDFRSVGDGYYCELWENNILNTRVFNKKNLYTPDEKNFKYSLLYHALIHKKKIADDYIEIFANMFDIKDFNELEEILNQYMRMERYNYVEPKDISVYYNTNFKKINLTCSMKKKYYFKFYFLLRFFIR